MSTGSRRPDRGVACLALAVLALAATLPPATARADVDLWPLFEWSDERQTLLYPLYSREGESLTAFPLYYRTREGLDHHLLWPLVKISDGTLVRAAPFWFSEREGSYVLFPLFRETERSFTSLVPPMHLRKDHDFQVVLPFFARSGESLWAAPNFYVEREQGHLVRFASFPILDVELDRAVATTDIEVALIAGAGLHEEKLEDAWLFPLFSLDRTGDDRHLWLAPVYHSPDTTAVFPAYYHRDDGHEKRLWVLPYLERESKHTRTAALVPFYSSRWQEHPRRNRTEHSVTALWPLYSRKEVRDAEGAVVERTRRFLVFRDRLRPDGVRRFEILGVPIGERVEGT